MARRIPSLTSGAWRQGLRALAGLAWLGGLASGLDAQALPGHWRPAFDAAPLAGAPPQGQSVHLVLGLALPDPAGLDAFLRRVYDPHDPLFRQFLTPDQFTQRFSPSQADYQAVLDFAHAQGFTVLSTFPNRLGVAVDAPVAAVERAFHLHLQLRQRDDHSVFYAPDREPAVDGRLALAHISGLDDFVRRRRHSQRRAKADAAAPIHQPRNGTAGDGYWLNYTGVSGFYQGWDLRQAYLPDAPASLQGQGQRIGLVEYQGYYQSDIVAYCAAQNPPLTPQVGAYKVDNYQMTPVVTPNPTETDPLGDNSEVSLDIEAARSMAPQANIVVFEAPYTASLADVLLAVTTFAPLCRQVSNSWTSDNSASIATYLATMAAQGQAFVNASGDNGAYNNNNVAYAVGFPDSLSPYITEAGGTSLTTQGPDGSPHWCTYTSESAWNNFYDPDSCNAIFNNGLGNASGGASGGGFCDGGSGALYSQALALPSWQAPFVNGSNGASNSYRNIPDVSMNGQGFWVTDNGPVAANANNDVYGGTNHDVLDGTSGAAPLWAGLLAVANQQAAAQGRGPIGVPNALLYQLAQTPTTYAQDFHDIADNSNNGLNGMRSHLQPTPVACDTVVYYAVTGYDLVTGLGSPRGMALVNSLVGLLPSPTATATPAFTRTDTPTVSPSPSITQTFTPSPTISDSPTASPTPSVTPTFTPSPTISDSPTASPTPAYLASGRGRCVLAPQPARAGQPVALYFKAAPNRTRWQVYDLAGEVVADLDIAGSGPHRCPTDKLAPGLYFAHIKVDYADSTAETLLLKFAVIR